MTSLTKLGPCIRIGLARQRVSPAASWRSCDRGISFSPTSSIRTFIFNTHGLEQRKTFQLDAFVRNCHNQSSIPDSQIASVEETKGKALQQIQIYCHKDTTAHTCRHNFEEETEKFLNSMINEELQASYIYQAMAFHFDRADVALPGFSKLFSGASLEERSHAEQLMTYMNLRGGTVLLQDVKSPGNRRWTALSAMEDALALEKKVTDNLLLLHDKAESYGDVQTCDFLEGGFLKEQAEAVKQFADHVTRLKLVGPGLGVWHYSRDLEHNMMAK